MSNFNFNRTLAALAAILLLVARPAIAIDWPMEPRPQAQPLGNTYGEYQNYGGTSYLHPGIDILRPAFTAVYAVKSGYVKAVLSTGGSLYWRVAIGDASGTEACDGWLYAHLDEWSIVVLEGQYVNEGQYLGDLVTWPVANFHHLHFSKISNTGQPWTSDWDFIGNPLEELSDQTDPLAPVFGTVDGGVLLAFCRDNTHTYFAPGAPLEGSVDIIARISDKIGHLAWDLTPHTVTYEIYDDTFSTGPILSVIATGFLHWTENVNVTYQDDATYNTRGDYDARDYYFIVTNTDGDSVVEASDVDGAWHTEEFANGDWWVKVTASDLGGNATTDSMLVTIENLFTLAGTAVPCDADPDSSGATITAPDLPGAPQWPTATDGTFILSDMTTGAVRLLIEREHYITIDTQAVFPGATLNFELQPAYNVGDLNADGFPDALDLAQMIDILFAGSTNWPEPYWSGDMDFDRFFTALDLSALIDVLFAGAEPPGAGHCYP
jgi:hypothetical protein